MRTLVIVGGGAVGSSIAYHTALRTNGGMQIIVVERDPSFARASSSLSASSIRQQFSTPVNIRLSQYGIAFLREAERVLAVDDDQPALGLREPGYLFLSSVAGLDVMQENHTIQQELDADVVLLGPEGLRSRFPWLSTEGVAAGSLGLSGEGWFDGPALLQAFRRKARSMGVEHVTAEVSAIDDDHHGCRVHLSGSDDCLRADRVVISAGGWSAQLAASVGLDVAITPRRRMVFVVACRARLPGCPLLIDPTGVWLRPEGPRFICGVSPAEGEDDPDEPPLEVDERLFFDRVWPVLAKRIPMFQELKLTSAWAGYYEMHLFDHNAVVGWIPGSSRVLIAAGFSGHGMQHSPGVGRAIAELVVHDEYKSLDLSALDPGRIAAGRRLVERNVV